MSTRDVAEGTRGTNGDDDRRWPIHARHDAIRSNRLAGLPLSVQAVYSAFDAYWNKYSWSCSVSAETLAISGRRLRSSRASPNGRWLMSCGIMVQSGGSPMNLDTG